MTARLLDGRQIASSINEAVRKKISQLTIKSGQVPKLVSLTVGSSEDAGIYVNMQKKAAEFVGINFEARSLDNTIQQAELIKEIKRHNDAREVTAIIVQKPLPAGMEHHRLISHIMPVKDAECVHPYNLGRIFRREADIVPCTPGAIMKILSTLEVDLYGMEVVIIGHSAIVGKPLSLMLLNETATTTVCHIATAEKGNLTSHAKRADILIVAVGRPEMIRGDWIKEGAVVIDVGINRMNDRIVGDVKFSEVKEKASAITPVPGGVGPVTVSILMRNVLRSFMEQNVKL